MPSNIFLFPAILLATGVGGFLRNLERGLKVLFFDNKPRSEAITNCRTLI